MGLGGAVQMLAGGPHGPHVGRRRRGHDRHPHPPEADQLALGLAALQRAVEGSGITARSHAVAITETISSLHW